MRKRHVFVLEVVYMNNVVVIAFIAKRRYSMSRVLRDMQIDFISERDVGVSKLHI